MGETTGVVCVVADSADLGRYESLVGERARTARPDGRAGLYEGDVALVPWSRAPSVVPPLSGDDAGGVRVAAVLDGDEPTVVDRVRLPQSAPGEGLRVAVATLRRRVEYAERLAAYADNAVARAVAETGTDDALLARDEYATLCTDVRRLRRRLDDLHGEFGREDFEAAFRAVGTGDEPPAAAEEGTARADRAAPAERSQ